jgi:hypothetical protein
LHSPDLEQTKWLYDVILLHYKSVGTLGQVFIVSHSYQTYFGFPGSDVNLDCGLRYHIITMFASTQVFVNYYFEYRFHNKKKQRGLGFVVKPKSQITILESFTSNKHMYLV